MAAVKLTKDEVARIAMLARLKLTDAELEKFAAQLTDILAAVDLLSEVDTDNVEPTAQVTGLQNVAEQDEIQNFVEDKSSLLAQSQGEIVDNQIVVPKVL